MKRTIFYSWQSDLTAATNRNLIEDALGRALKAIRRDETEMVEPVLDRDTAGLPGAPAIADSILAKIMMADIFVGDVTIINSDIETRPTPNPNVLIELGYAVAQLGWDRILLVQNSAYGGPETLPFDLRGRRVVAYEAPNVSSVNKAEIRALLQGRLEVALRRALGSNALGVAPSGPDTGLWWGTWSFGGGQELMGGELFIREVGSEGFLFDLRVYNGAHTGELTAFARLASKDLAYARVQNGDEEFGELVFRRSGVGRQRAVEVEETASCHYYRGARAYFGGQFLKEREPWFDAGFMNEIELSRLYSVTGQYYDKLKQCTWDISCEYMDDIFVSKVLVGGVPGLYTLIESIIQIGKAGELWVAFTEDDQVWYFTNQPNSKSTLPAPIERWRSRFAERKVVFPGEIVLTPPVLYARLAGEE
jgi:hypothetical protein